MTLENLRLLAAAITRLSTDEARQRADGALRSRVVMRRA